MQKNNSTSKSVKILTTASMLTAIGVIVGFFCKNYLNLAPGIRITFEGFPTILSGILFGSTIGGFVGFSIDFISYLISNQSQPIHPIILLGSISLGVISGLVSHHIIKKRSGKQLLISSISAHLIGSIIIKSIGIFDLFGSMFIVLPRMLVYVFIIVPIEIILLCWMFRRGSFKRLFSSVEHT